MTDIHDKIIENDRLLANIKRDMSGLFQHIAVAMELESKCIVDNCELRLQLRGEPVLEEQEIEKPSDVIVALDSEILDKPVASHPKSNGKFEEIIAAFPNYVPDSLNSDNKDDAFVRSILTRIQLGVNTTIKPEVDNRERGVYLTLNGDVVLFRKSEYKEKWKANSIFLNVDLGDFLLFNNSDYCLLGRYQGGSNSDGFKDWSIFDISKFVIKEDNGKIFLCDDQNKQVELKVREGITPYIIVRSEDGPPIIHSG